MNRWGIVKCQGTDGHWSKTMSVADVENAVRLVARAAEEHGLWLAGNETAVRCAPVDPILWAPGWSTRSPLECRPNFNQGHHGLADYVLLDPYGDIAVLMVLGTAPAHRLPDRQRLMTLTRGTRGGVAVLTYGTVWEIYDLNLRVVRFRDKLVEGMILGRDAPQDVANAPHHWLPQGLWWNAPARREVPSAWSTSR